MYTSYIGKKFLTLFNEREKTNYSAKEFFNKEFYKIFFDDEKHLLHVGNSPFFQKPKEDDVRKYGSKSLAQYNNLITAIENDVPNMSIFVGSQAKDVGGTTSGQVTGMKININQNEMYASWIGETLGIGVSGGYVLLIEEPDVLWTLYTGWKYYRQYLSQTPNVKDKQIETWNGQWLWHWGRPFYNSAHPNDNLHIETSEVQGNIAIPTQQWSKIIFVLSRKFPNKTIIAYSYNLSQTNTTLGFINLYLPEVHGVYDIRDKLMFENNMVLIEEELETLSTFYNFKEACKLGTIGLKAIEPAKLREYMPKGSFLYAQGKEYNFSTDESFKNYQLFKIWIVAMLNKTELLNLASKMASALLNFEKFDERGKKVCSTLSQEVRESGNLKTFIDNLTKVLNQYPDEADIFKEVIEQVLKMPTDNFPLFVTLIRFEYSYKKTKNN